MLDQLSRTKNELNSTKASESPDAATTSTVPEMSFSGDRQRKITTDHTREVASNQIIGGQIGKKT